MEPRGSMLHSQGLSNNPYPEPNKFNSPLWYLPPQGPRSSHLSLCLSKGLFPVGLPVKILKALLPSSILATWLAPLNLLDLITLTILGERYKLLRSSWSLLHSPFSSLLGPNIRLGSFFQIPLAWIPPLMWDIMFYIYYSTTGNAFSYILIFKFLARRQK